MNILIIDGNEKAASDRYVKIGMDTQYEVYAKILKKLSNNSFNISVIHPAINENFIPEGMNLDDFTGFIWTGSVLNIYENTPSILRQIELAKTLINKENFIFGSCWGLQVLVTAAGGKIRKNPNGLEAIVAKDIKLNNFGKIHPMYKGKNSTFDSFCWHYDDAETLPPHTTVLASNKKSKIQSINFDHKKSIIWAVQYHPEFNPLWMSGLMKQREKLLIDESIYRDKQEFDLYKNFFSNIKEQIGQNNLLQLSDNIIDEDKHSIELLNWINFIKNQN